LGILIVGLRATVNKPLGALGGYIDLASQRFGFRTFLLLGFVLGGAASQPRAEHSPPRSRMEARRWAARSLRCCSGPAR